MPISSAGMIPTLLDTSSFQQDLKKPQSSLHLSKKKKINQKVTLENYQILEVLGKGSFASVKLVIDKSDGKKYAIKIYEKFKLQDPNKFKNIRREINLLYTMKHENIIMLYHVIETVSSLNLIMEYIGNHSLYSYLKNKKKEQLPMNQVRKIFKQIIEGVNYIHQKKVCHRDIKLENILLDDDLNIKIIDFGFAVCSPPDRKLNSFCGTPSYMAPEIVKKHEYSGQKVDIWSCGIVLYILVCGKFPFKGHDEKDLYRKILKNNYEIPSFVDTPIKSLIQKLLTQNPDDRPQSWQILQDSWISNEDEIND